MIGNGYGDGAGIYRRRRRAAVVLVLVLAVVAVLLVRSATSSAGRPDTSSAGGPASRTPTAPTTTTGPAGPTTTTGPAGPTPTSGTAATPGAAGTSPVPPPGLAECRPGDLAVSLAVSGVGGAAPQAGSPVRLAAALSSTAGCRLTAAPSAVRLTVTSGADRVWDSTGCPVATTGAGAGVAAAGQALLLPAQTTVPVGGTALVNVVWPGVRLGAGCAPASTALRAGTYTATLRLPGASAVATAFQLR